MTGIARNVSQTRERIAEAALQSGRDPDGVTLVAVTKTFPAETVIAAYELGLRHFGENRVEEGSAKIPLIRAGISGPAPTWHMVGHVQSRKAEAVVSCFDMVHSVDRLKLARRLDRFAQASGRVLPVLIECNVSGEASKDGFDVVDWARDPDRWEAFLAAAQEMLGMPGLAVGGLMTMAPWGVDPETVRPVFAGLRGLREALGEAIPGCALRHLSMGMSDDFEVAVEEGATMVRLGRALFGPR
jgi:pyridoxal phosphate enzyme (YggS family)